jgi:RNA polymerase sigma-70 factor (ECF subfamily)
VAWEGLNGAQLAAALGISEGGAAAALSRARSRLEESLAGVQGMPAG